MKKLTLPSDMPPMPKDWWPDSVTVHGKHGKYELKFEIHNTDDIEKFEDFRFAFWTAEHTREA